MAAYWFNGIYSGCEHVTGTKKDGTKYDFYNFCIRKEDNENILGAVFDVVSGSGSEFPELLKRESVGKKIRYVKQNNKYLFICEFI